MKITIEQVDEILKRKNVTYTQAKVALEEAEGDILTALTLLDDIENKKEEPQKSFFKKEETKERLKRESEKYSGKIRDAVKRLHRVKVKIHREGDVILSLPGTVASVLAILNIPLTVLALIVIHLVGLRLEFQNTGMDEKLNSTINRVKSNIEDQLK